MSNQPRGQRFRVRGSGYTVISYNGKQLTFVEVLRDTAPPCGRPRSRAADGRAAPDQIAFPKAAGIGTLVVTVTEQWDREVWRQFPGYGAGVINDIVDVFARSASIGGVTAMKIIITLPRVTGTTRGDPCAPRGITRIMAITAPATRRAHAMAARMTYTRI
jgi:hypothetical protein